MKTYGFKDVKGAVENGGSFQVNFGKLQTPTHLILSIEQARILMGDDAVNEIMKRPVITLKEIEDQGW
jgi:hypothetical protein